MSLLPLMVILSKLFLPLILSVFSYFIKIPGRRFCGKISLRAGHTYRRYGKFYLDLLAFFGVEVKVSTQIFTGYLREILYLVKLTPETAV
jgi:hypothetical protein